MTSKPLFLVPFLLIVIPDLRVSAGLPGLGDIQMYANFANDAIGVLKGELSWTTLFTGSTGPTMDKILDSVSGISKQLDDFGNSFRAQLDAQSRRFDERFDEMNEKLDKILMDIPLEGKASLMTRELHSYITQVDYLYAKYERYSAGRDNFNNYTIKKFIEAVTSDKRGDLDNTLSRVFSLVIPERSESFTDGIFDILALQLANTAVDVVCGTKKSAQLQLYEIYQAIVVTETRGFIMSIFCYALISVFKRTSFDFELNFQRDQLVKRIDDYLRITAKSMQGIARKIELCDAHTYTEGIDYVHIDKLTFENSELGLAISTMPRIADIKNNMVMSGIRFTNTNDKMIDYQIQEARLLPQGVIDNRNQSWKELPSIVYSEYYGFYHYANETYRDDRDYFLMSIWLRFMLMDDLVLPHNYVLAGVIFQTNYEQRHFAPCIYGVKFDFSSGKLDPTDTMWISSEYVYNKKDLRDTGRRKYPTEATENFIDTKPKDLVMLGPVGEGESPIGPFFDTRSVDLRYMSLALSGIGTYHRGAAGYGGYFNFRLFSIDLSEYVKY